MRMPHLDVCNIARLPDVIVMNPICNRVAGSEGKVRG